MTNAERIRIEHERHLRRTLADAACADCLYYRPGGIAGKCHISPPQFYSDDGRPPSWPDVLGSSWCGAFVRKEGPR